MKKETAEASDKFKLQKKKNIIMRTNCKLQKKINYFNWLPILPILKKVFWHTENYHWCRFIQHLFRENRQKTTKLFQ